MKNIIVITGPTGVGKTKLSVELAKIINGEVVNADSMQVYKDLNIGTAKIKEEEKENIMHHLFDIASPNEMYTIYNYQKDCRRVIEDILSRGKKAILVGGSGLYIRAALYNYNLVKEEVKKDYTVFSNEELLSLVNKIDSNADIHVNNRKRLIRFLEKNDNGNLGENNSNPIYDFSIIGLTTDRDNLYNIINNRVDKMLDEGLLDEVTSLFKKGINSKAINTGIGYKELYSYLNHEISFDDAIELIKRNSRRYAKRQYTFFNNQFNVKWFDTNYSNFSSTVKEVYNYLEEVE